MAEEPGMWRTELNDLVRAFGGAFLFGMPLLYTQEMWWIADYIDVWKLGLFLAVALAANFLLGQIAKRRRQLTWQRALAEMVENVAIGMVAAAIVLFALGRIHIGDVPLRVLTRMLLLTIPLSLGAAVAHSTRPQGAGQKDGDEKQVPHSPWVRLREEISMTAAGSLFIAFTLAPILEITVLTARLGYWRMLGLVALGMAFSYLIVYRSGLNQQEEPSHADFLWPVTDTLMAYSVALVVALVSLFLFDRIQVGDQPAHVLGQAIVLGLPTAIGGAAGRKVI